MVAITYTASAAAGVSQLQQKQAGSPSRLARHSRAPLLRIQPIDRTPAVAKQPQVTQLPREQHPIRGHPAVMHPRLCGVAIPQCFTALVLQTTQTMPRYLIIHLDNSIL
jgi:hypothetical protein